MCFYKNSSSERAKTAKKNIQCFKVLQRNGKSLIQDFKYDLSKTKIYSVKKFTHDDDSINQGFHSYSTLTQAKWRDGCGWFVKPFIIPKGTKYYYNKDREEYVSLAIKYVKMKKK